MDHWIIKYLNKPWESGSSGPNSYDCYGLLRAIYSDQLNIDLPIAPHVPEPNDIYGIDEVVKECVNEWIEIEKPENMCAVLMSTSGKYWHHIGIYIDCDRGRVFHIPEGGMVTGESTSRIKRRFKGMKFYRYGNIC